MKTQSREIRFIAKSAQEAVEQVRNELGPDAKVISVRQVTGTGLQRFLKAPQLEIVAREFEPLEESFAVETDPLEDEIPGPVESPRASYRPEKPFTSCRELLVRAGFSPGLDGTIRGSGSLA